MADTPAVDLHHGCEFEFDGKTIPAKPGQTIAGALHGAPLRVVKCLTNEVRVPADAEIVVEGRLLPKVRELEGPFGEFPQYYGEAAKRHTNRHVCVTK